ncbi:MAG TPA: glutamate 5-kinase [Myxococcota bacterium]|nr:glutamate 5-kinase [Myxococcota bacterium]
MSPGARGVAARARRLVVKVGSSVLTRDGRVRPRVFTDVARQVAALQDEGREVVLVSSGAIAIGSHALGWSHPGRSIPEKQAAAAVGQIGLSEIYKRRFAAHGKPVAQVLVTRTGLEDRERFLNARHTLLTLLRLGVVPVVNENDTVATEEIRFGDNDNLSATVVNLVAAELLVILTNVDGLYAEPPTRSRPRPPLVERVDEITPEIERAARGASSAFGRGGMLTKLEAARSAARSGAATVVCNGLAPDSLLRVARGEPAGTIFLAGTKLGSRKHWLAYTAAPRGRLVLDDGAVRALLERGRSLLPAGIASVEGRFGIGDPVACVDARGREVARGLVAYTAAEVDRIKGLSTKEAVRVLGYSNGDEVIHRDDLVLLEPRPQGAGARG